MRDDIAVIFALDERGNGIVQVSFQWGNPTMLYSLLDSAQYERDAKGSGFCAVLATNLPGVGSRYFGWQSVAGNELDVASGKCDTYAYLFTGTSAATDDTAPRVKVWITENLEGGPESVHETSWRVTNPEIGILKVEFKPPINLVIHDDCIDKVVRFRDTDGMKHFRMNKLYHWGKADYIEVASLFDEPTYTDPDDQLQSLIQWRGVSLFTPDVLRKRGVEFGKHEYMYLWTAIQQILGQGS